MGIFSVKCPQCGVILEADEKYIGARAACAECDFHFILPKVTEEVTPVIELRPVNSTQSQTEIAPGLKDQDKVNNVPAPNAKKAGGSISLSSNIKAFRFHPDILEAIVAQRIYLVKDLFSISFEKLSSEFNIGAQKIEAMSILINALRERLQESGNITLSSLPLSILLSPLGSKDYPALNEEPDEEHEEEKSFSHNSDQIFQRNLTYATLTGGLSVPAAQSDFFLDNISSYPQPHKGLPVTIIFKGEKYSANFAEVVSQTSSKIMYQLRWGGRKSAIFNLLQSIFSKAYTQFSLERRKFGSCNIIMTFSRGTILDEFILKVDISTDTTNPAKDKINVPDSKDITAESVDKNEQIENVGLQKRETPSLDALKHSFEECDEAFFQKKTGLVYFDYGICRPQKTFVNDSFPFIGRSYSWHDTSCTFPGGQ